MEKVLLRHRSPAYPAISLPKALEQARKFYTAQKHHPAPASAAVSIWGFGAKSSGGLQAISALKQYGLMSESGEAESRHLQLTDLALRIIRDEREPSPERDESIRQAALSPKIYAEMWEKWGLDVPAEPTIRYFLEQDKKYNGDYINALIADYKDTIAFAKFGEIDKLPSENGHSGSTETDKDDPPANTGSVRLSVPPPPSPGVKLMEGERVVFTHEIEPSHHLRLAVAGPVDDKMLDALEQFVTLQKRQNRKKISTDLSQDLKRIDDEMGLIVRAAVEPKIRAEMEPIIRSSVPDADDPTIERMVDRFVDGWMEQHYKRSVL